MFRFAQPLSTSLPGLSLLPGPQATEAYKPLDPLETGFFCSGCIHSVAQSARSGSKQTFTYGFTLAEKLYGWHIKRWKNSMPVFTG
jgi:hypothetical protein